MRPEPAEPLFTVVIALYNKREYIQATLRSVLAQREPDFNIVVVDDGSTDGSAELVRAMADPRIHLIGQPNGGVSQARNTGMAAATGRWCVFLDADDLQHPSFLSTLRWLAQHAPQCEMLATGAVDVEPPAALAWWQQAVQAPAPALHLEHIELIEDLPARWMRGLTMMSSSLAVKRSLLQRMPAGFAVGESHGEDLDMWFRVAERTPLAFIALPLIGRVVDPTGLSSQTAARSEPPFAERMVQRVRQGECPAPLRASSLRYVTHYRLFLARTAVVSGHRRLALSLLWRVRAVCYTPGWLLTLLLIVLPRRLAYPLHRWRIDGKVPP
ncbi:glycosyltransferase family 2 protein [Ideonella paludis]|uniref:Glycosyltransferase n=1 Tax=Ideonella paludis TaxID=1233411 RepID=A0ABS5DS41_9BURK|nr:glycosyltransferase family 2 protein [Ideonella paludis]MBQ0933726.1 glycosyltransferase [Ideonella paludis]